MYASSSKRRNLLWAVLLGGVFCAVGGGADAAVIVFSNETARVVTFIIGDSADVPASHKAYRITSGDVLSVPVADKQKIVWFDANQNQNPPGTASSAAPVRDIRSVTVKPNSIYTFSGEGTPSLAHHFSITVPETPEASSAKPSAKLDQVVQIPVMILVDDEEPRRQELWERELRERMKQASDIFEKTCLIRFQVVKVGRWETRDGETDFDRTFQDFQRTVRLEPGVALAIGFTSQYEVQTQNRFHMGGTKGPLYPYTLIREWSQHVSPSERLEVLVHELGHVLGATHTPDQSSVMRPVVGDKQSNARGFRIGFDPMNTLAVYLFCEPLRLEGVRSLRQYSPSSRASLMSVYGELDRRFPGEGSASIYQKILRQTATVPPPRYGSDKRR